METPVADKIHNFEKGEILLFDKPFDWSSYDLIKKLRYTIRNIKIGHAGTLDPYATGLMIICTGNMTKKVNDFTEMEKEYTGELVLGKTTPSFDLETEFDSERDISGITEEMIHEAAKTFLGNIMQTPPAFSAVKVGGVRSYKKARKGEEVIIAPKEITVREFAIEKIELPKVQFRIVCSKGTYIRSLVRDLGEKLNTGAYLSELRRTRIGDFNVNSAHNIHDFIKLIRKKG